MEDAMKSEGEFLIEKELTPIKSRKLVAVDSGEMDEIKERAEKERKGQNQEGEKEGDNTDGVGVR